MTVDHDVIVLDSVHAEVMVHPSATVEPGAVIGPRTRIWHGSHIRSGSTIGADCNIGFAVYVDVEAVIGNGCKIQNHASIYRGVTLHANVFVGPSVAFTNDFYPRATSKTWEVSPTLVGIGASIGANATIRCGVEIGPYAMVGCGAVVTRDVPAHALVLGTPAHIHGWVCFCGCPLANIGEPMPARCSRCGVAVVFP